MNYSINYRYGKIGSIGEKGEKGSFGDKSEIGLKGLRGDRGDRGAKGEPGTVGSKGNIGDEGIIGKSSENILKFKGSIGDKGIDSSKLLDIEEYDSYINFKYTNDNYTIEKLKINGLKGDLGTSGLKGYAYHDINDTVKGDKGIPGEVGNSSYNLVNILIFKNSFNYLFREINNKCIGFFNVPYNFKNKKLYKINDLYKYGYTSNDNTYIEYSISLKDMNEFYLPVFNYDNLLINYCNKLGLIDINNIIGSDDIFKESIEKINSLNSDSIHCEVNNVYQIYINNPFLTNKNGILYEKNITYHSQNNTTFKNMFFLHINVLINQDSFDKGFTINNSGKFVNSESNIPDFNKYHGFCVINDLKYFIPVTMYVRLEQHINNNENNLKKKLVRYTDWIPINRNGTYNLSSVCWHRYREFDSSNLTNINVRYTFSLPYNLLLGNVTPNFIYDIGELGDYFDIYNINPDKNSDTLDKYDLLDNDLSGKVSLTHLLFSKIHIRELIINLS